MTSQRGPNSVDVLTREQRSALMSRVRSRDTSPERVVRSALYRLGIRFRIHRRDLPGCPDILIPRLKVVIFVHGCFWHLHSGCKAAALPRTNVDFWSKKLLGNVTRFEGQRRQLEEQGWEVMVLWECQLGPRADVERLLLDALEKSPRVRALGHY